MHVTTAKTVEAHLHRRVDVLRYAEGVRRKAEGRVVRLRSAVVAKVHDSALLDSGRRPAGRAVERLVKAVAKEVDKSYEGLAADVATALGDLAADEQAYLLELWGGGRGLARLSATRLKEIVRTTLVQGADLGAWWRKQAADLAHRTASAVRLGAAQDEDTADLAGRVSGRASGKIVTVKDAEGKSVRVRRREGDPMAGSVRDAGALVRTAAQAVANAVGRQLYAANRDRFRGRTWVSVLDSRTTDLCRSLNGLAWDVRDKPLGGSRRRFPGEPPLHWNCRSLLVPFTAQAATTPPPAVPASYEEWFKSLPETRQKAMLGPVRWRKWKEGKAGLSDLLDYTSHNPIPLAILQKSRPR